MLGKSFILCIGVKHLPCFVVRNIAALPLDVENRMECRVHLFAAAVDFQEGEEGTLLLLLLLK